ETIRIIRHVGSVYGDRYPEPLIQSMRRLIASGRLNPSSVRLDLVGPLSVPGVNLPAEPWFQCTPRQVSKNEANRLIQQADYLLLLDVTTNNIGLQVPAKIFDYIQIGRPIIARTVRESPVDRILGQSGIPHACLYAGDSEDEIDRRLLE